jgi:putative hydrolase of the HAD superfamily
MNGFNHVEHWVFDMDDTLYPREQGLMHLVQARINAFVVEAVGMAPDEAAILRRQFLDEYGTTLAGLMANYAIDTDRFLHEVHDVPLDGVEPNPPLAALLKALPGRCYVYTNGARDYARRVLNRIGIADCFSGVFAIEDADLTPKPAPSSFRRMLDRFDIDSHAAAFFDDTPRNLEPAKALGMTTVLIGDDHGQPPGAHIDHAAPYLFDFLSGLNSYPA